MACVAVTVVSADSPGAPHPDSCVASGPAAFGNIFCQYGILPTAFTGVPATPKDNSPKDDIAF